MAGNTPVIIRNFSPDAIFVVPKAIIRQGIREGDCMPCYVMKSVHGMACLALSDGSRIAGRICWVAKQTADGITLSSHVLQNRRVVYRGRIGITILIHRICMAFVAVVAALNRRGKVVWFG